MNSFSKKVSDCYFDLIPHTELGKLCGSKKLFRDRYAILRILGRGGFGVTFLARNVTLPGYPLCVIKQLCPKVKNTKTWERARNRFEKEAKTLGQLGSHSQIPMLIDYFETCGEFYLVQEYVRGCNLAQEIRHGGCKSETSVKQFLQEILPVLDYIHKNHVIHRDIKPHNLLRCHDDGRLVLIDFGAVRDELVSAGNNSTTHGATTNFVGTMGFAPPEQFSLRPVYASDIYAVGVTCLCLLTGKAPLEFDHDPDTGEICWQGKVDVSQHFSEVLDKMIKLSLKERFKSADDVMFALGIEPFLENFVQCLSRERLGTHRVLSNEEQGYIPPIKRTAIAIRNWRAKLKSKQLQGQMGSSLS